MANSEPGNFQSMSFCGHSTNSLSGILCHGLQSLVYLVSLVTLVSLICLVSLVSLQFQWSVYIESSSRLKIVKFDKNPRSPKRCRSPTTIRNCIGGRKVLAAARGIVYGGLGLVVTYVNAVSVGPYSRRSLHAIESRPQKLMSPEDLHRSELTFRGHLVKIYARIFSPTGECLYSPIPSHSY